MNQVCGLRYGESKYRAERLLLDDDSNVSKVIARAPWFYGENQPSRQRRFLEMIRKDCVPMVGPGDNMRSMVYVGNLSQGLLGASKSDSIATEIYWIADRQSYSMNTIVSTMQMLFEAEFGIEWQEQNFRFPKSRG